MSNMVFTEKLQVDKLGVFRLNINRGGDGNDVIPGRKTIYIL